MPTNAVSVHVRFLHLGPATINVVSPIFSVIPQSLCHQLAAFNRRRAQLPFQLTLSPTITG
jgi:hypothetical protein